MRRSRGLHKVWVLALALLVALGAMGVTYSAWTDEIYITGTLATGDVNATLTCGDEWEVPETEGTDIDCDTGDPMTLDISVTNALEGVEYYCEFDINNASTSFPVKVDGVDLSGSYTGVSASVDISPLGLQIDPGDTETGRVNIHLTTDASAGDTLNYTLEVSVKRWNE